VQHLLDRPVWNALGTDWAHLAEGDDQARRLDREHGVFGAAADRSAAKQTALAALVPGGGELWLIEREVWPTPPGTRKARSAEIVQMVAEALAPGHGPDFAFVELSDNDARRCTISRY
jgi:hypothetical protein